VRDLDFRIEASLIGRNVTIGRGPTLPKAYRFVVGDNSEIAIL
jgi:glucose-1-phosphate thymidylyltransferase